MKQDQHSAKPQHHTEEANVLDIDAEIIIVDCTPNNDDLEWTMSAMEALQVNYLTRSNRSIFH